RQISTLFTHASQYRVVLEADINGDNGLAALGQVYAPAAAGGQPVPLSSLVQVQQRHAPLVVERQGQFPATTLSFNLAPGHSLGQAVDAIETAAREIGLPATVELDFQGAAQAFRASLANTLWLILAAVVV